MDSIERLEYRSSPTPRGTRGQTYTIGVRLMEIANRRLPQIVDGINATIAPSNYKATIGNDQTGARIAVEVLIARGPTDILMITPELRHCVETGVIRQREIGYMDAMARRHGLAYRMRILRIPNAGPESIQQSATCFPHLSGRGRFFCWSDIDGVRLTNPAKTMGLDVPGDIAIVAYDNSSISGLPFIDLASIDEPGRELGSASAELLLSRIGGRSEARYILVEPKRVERSSIQGQKGLSMPRQLVKLHGMHAISRDPEADQACRRR